MAIQPKIEQIIRQLREVEVFCGQGTNYIRGMS